MPSCFPEGKVIRMQGRAELFYNLLEDCSIAIANALEILQSCTYLSKHYRY